MDPSDFKNLKNKVPYLESPAFLDAQRLASDPDIVALHDISRKVPKAQGACIPPEALVASSTAIAALKGMNISHINSFLGHLDQIPKKDFKVIKQTVSQNRSEIRDAAKANYETAADIVKKASESNANETLEFSEAVAQLINDIDDSIELPDPDADKKIHILKSHPSFSKIIALIGVILSLYAIYQNQSSSELIKQNHSEQMQEERKQTQLNKQAVELEEQQTEYLKQIAEDTASANNADLSSDVHTKNKTQH